MEINPGPECRDRIDRMEQDQAMFTSAKKRASRALAYAFTATALSVGALAATSAIAPDAAIAAPAAKLSAQQAQSVQGLTNYFNQLSNIKGDFVQVGPKGHISQGLFYISKPGKLRFEYAPPNPFLVVSDGSYVIINNKNNKKTDYYPLSKTPLQLVLAPKVNLLQEANVVDVRYQDNLTAITLEDKGTFVSGQLILVFDEKKSELLQWIIVDGSGNRTTISLSNVTSGERPDPKLFVFNAPRDIQTRSGGSGR